MINGAQFTCFVAFFLQDAAAQSWMESRTFEICVALG